MSNKQKPAEEQLADLRKLTRKLFAQIQADHNNDDRQFSINCDGEIVLESWENRHRRTGKR